MSLEQPNWKDISDRMLYDDLLATKRELTEEEDFCKKMYHQEELWYEQEQGYLEV